MQKYLFLECQIADIWTRATAVVMPSYTQAGLRHTLSSCGYGDCTFPRHSSSWVLDKWFFSRCESWRPKEWNRGLSAEWTLEQWPGQQAPLHTAQQAHRGADGEDADGENEHRMRHMGPGPQHHILQFQDVLLQKEKRWDPKPKNRIGKTLTNTKD